jgi:hypothetical protein
MADAYSSAHSWGVAKGSLVESVRKALGDEKKKKKRLKRGDEIHHISSHVLVINVLVVSQISLSLPIDISVCALRKSNAAFSLLSSLRITLFSWPQQLPFHPQAYLQQSP